MAKLIANIARLCLVGATGCLGLIAMTMVDSSSVQASKWPTVSLYDQSIYDRQGNFKDWHAYNELGFSLKKLCASNYNYNGYRRQSKAPMDSRYKYKTANSKGKVYSISGPEKIKKDPYIANTKLKVTHHLKNYKHVTWTRTKYTFVKHKGKWTVYYFVKTKKHHTSGWVKLTDLRLIGPLKLKRITHAQLVKHPDSIYDIDQVYRVLTTKERNEYANSNYMCDAGVEGFVPRYVTYRDLSL